MDRAGVWQAVEAERLRLADVLEGLSPEQWDVASLCAGWRVRDVAGHVTLSTRARPITALLGLVQARGDFNRYVAAEARARSARPPATLVDELRAVAGSRHHPPGTKPEDALVDVIVHAMDVARPLGIDHRIGTDRLEVAAERLWSMSFPFHARRRNAGVHLRATAAAWERGAGAEASGPLDDLVLWLAGRPEGLRRLEGPGAEALRARTPGTKPRREPAG